jgi:hypothetical protein
MQINLLFKLPLQFLDLLKFGRIRKHVIQCSYSNDKKKLEFQLKSITDLLLKLRPVQPHPGPVVALFSSPTTIALAILKRIDQQNHPGINSIGRNQSMNRETTRLLVDHTACG